MRRPILAVVAAATILGASVAPVSAQDGTNATPIPMTPGWKNVASFIGSPATAHPVETRAIPQNPYMSPGAWAGLHNDAYASDTYLNAGPLGKKPVVTSAWTGSEDSPIALAAAMTFDQAGRIVAGPVMFDHRAETAYVQLTLIEPGSLRTLATLDLPTEAASGADFRPSGTYFYQDEQYRTVIGTSERSIWVASHDASSFRIDEKIDLTSVIPAGDKIEALQPDWSGRVWFTSAKGAVGTVDLAAGAILGWYHMPAGERVVNGHSADETGGVFIASSAAMYRFDADASGAPAVTWREAYDPGTRKKPGQVDIGTGTTPTVMGSDYVTITDNADPQMHVLVYRRAKTVEGSRLACSVPVFAPYQSDTENSLVATDRSIIVENNYGYASQTVTDRGHTITPGITRIDMDADGTCHTVWTNERVNIPSVVTKMSLANGLIYSYTKPFQDDGISPWYFTAIDFRTGEVAWSQLAGTGQLYNNHYAPVYLGPDGTLYSGVLGGIVAMKDGK